MWFDQQLKINFRKSLAPPFPEKIHSLPPQKIQKVQVLPLFAYIEIFSVPPPPYGKGWGEHCSTMT